MRRQGHHDDGTSRRELVSVYDLGPRGTMASYLWVSDGSSSDLPDPQSAVSRVDAMIAIPILEWSPPGESLADRLALRTQVTAVDAVELQDGGIPLVMGVPPGLRFSLREHPEGTKLTVTREPGSPGLFGAAAWPIEERLVWFLRESGTLTLVMTDDDGIHVWVTTVLAGQQPPVPLVGQHRGTVRQKNAAQLVAHSSSWDFGLLGNESLMADRRDACDDHHDVYVSTTDGWQLPAKLEHVGSCLACDEPADSNEHCTPNWIARDQGVQPVTADLFCLECNNYFGTTLEEPVATLYREGLLSEELGGDLFARWAIKTALTLSSASGVRLHREWMTELRQGHTPGGFEIYAATPNRTGTQGYSFGTTMMSSARRAAGAFLATFSMPHLAFVVVRTAHPLESFGPLPRVHPALLPATEHRERVELTELHGEFLKAITGHSVRFTDKPGRKPQNHKP